MCFSTLGAIRPDWHLYARQDSYLKDLPHPDLQSTPVAEDPRVRCHGLVSGIVVVFIGRRFVDGVFLLNYDSTFSALLYPVYGRFEFYIRFSIDIVPKWVILKWY